jgi:hypothetical protein
MKKPQQLNGKSANLNHVLLHKIYPTVRRPEDVPAKDIFMVMDCDHMVRMHHQLWLTVLSSDPSLLRMEIFLLAQVFCGIVAATYLCSHGSLR